MSRINTTELRPNQMIVVDGIVDFSHIRKLIEGTALDNYNQNSRSMFKETRPFTTITISSPVLVPADPNGVKTKEELYVESKFYDSKGENGTVRKCFRINSKSPILPNVGQFEIRPDGTPDPNSAIIFNENNGKELARGLKVRLLIRTFASGDFANKGITLSLVLAKEPIRYFESAGNQALNYLAQTGVTVKFASPAPDAQPAPENAVPSNPIPTPSGNPYRNDAPAPAPMPAPTPTTAAEPAQEVQPPADWDCPVCHTKNPGHMNFCGNCGKPKDTPPQSDFNPQGGIRIDPNAMNKSY